MTNVTTQQFHYWMGAHPWMNSENFSDTDRVNELSRILIELVNGDTTIKKLRNAIESSGVLDLGGQQEKVEKLLEDYHPNEIGRLIGVSEEEGKKIVREIYFGWGYTEVDDWEAQDIGEGKYVLALKQGDEWIDEDGNNVLFDSKKEARSHLRKSLRQWHEQVALNTYS